MLAQHTGATDPLRRTIAAGLAIWLLEKMQPWAWFDGAVWSRDEAERLINEASQRVHNWKSQIYEVTKREPLDDGLLVRVEFIGQDDAVQIVAL